ncbi:MAG: deoxyguanosinetriphosphate triphosphohydrolase [Candidatus Omnitrophica bacterium]|nr:deoxyguanosinetriphosphate triphosphohydrolase [Candidatus Omnitrophota bacterium]
MQTISRKEIEDREEDLLAPYAMKSRDTLGRVHKEEEHPLRTVYQRDRDRIIYSNAFRRLEYKTQVFVNHEGDYYRTRLTHTLEVAQIARTIARALRLNEDLVEAISLAHDLGHTPFGHAGEDALAELMKDHGGFDHNSHGLRVVDYLEEKYADFPGLNLTSELRRGIICHSTPFDIKRADTKIINGPWLLEIQVVDIADEIAYDNHDLDDGLKSGMISEDDLFHVDLWKDTQIKLSEKHKLIGLEQKRSGIVRNLINFQVQDLLETTIKSIENKAIKNTSDIDNIKEKIVVFSDEMLAKRKQLKKVLNEKLYRHYRVVRMSHKATKFLKALFLLFKENPDVLPPSTQNKINFLGLERTICDYIAGMTDRYALDQYKKLFEPYERV